MAVLTQEQLETLFQSVTVAMTGLASKFVRIAYASEGQPAWENTQNVACLSVSVIDNPYDKQRNIAYKDKATPDPDEVEESISYTTVLSVDWVIYGPLSLDLALAIKSNILKPAIRALLRPSNIFPLTEIQAPVRLPYNFNGRWWNRSDVRVLFNLESTEKADIPTFASASVEVSESGGPSVLITIPLD